MRSMVFLFLIYTSTVAMANDNHSSTCASKSNILLSPFNLNQPSIIEVCKCVAETSPEALNSSKLDWSKDGKNSITYITYQCARKDITNFFKNSQIQRMLARGEKSGANVSEEVIEKIKLFSTCFGDGMYHSVLVGTESGTLPSTEATATAITAKVMNNCKIYLK